MELSFLQVDVFAAEPFRGNPLAVAVGADGLSDVQMANWTNLNEKTFLLSPTHPDADYRVYLHAAKFLLPDIRLLEEHTCGEKHWRSEPMRFHIVSADCSAAFRSKVLSLAKTCSIGLRSGL